jgi:nucleoside-diphosphate-sugar epimerase
MTKVLIIGKNSFIGSNLKKSLSKKFKVEILSFEQVKKKNNLFFLKYTHIINTAIHKKYIKNKYDKIYDLDRVFISRFKKIQFIYIFLNTRKIYLQKENISEKSLLKPRCQYGKNKLITEIFLKKKIKRKLLSLRIGNIIGKRLIKNKRNNHKLFFDNFLLFKKNKKNFLVANDFKDFLSIVQFSRIVSSLIQKKINGIYNISLSQKIYISELIYWLDVDYFKKINFTNKLNDSFTLSNKKLLKKIGKKPLKIELKKFCKNILR